MRLLTRSNAGEAKMVGTRRDALKLVAGAAAMVTAGAWLARGQDATQRSPKANGESPLDAGMDPKRAKAILEENQKDIKKNIEKLFQLASDLKEEVGKTDATTVLSLAIVRKTEEIEKLARQIRDRAKG